MVLKMLTVSMDDGEDGKGAIRAKGGGRKEVI